MLDNSSFLSDVLCGQMPNYTLCFNGTQWLQHECCQLVTATLTPPILLVLFLPAFLVSTFHKSDSQDSSIRHKLPWSIRLRLKFALNTIASVNAVCYSVLVFVLDANTWPTYAIPLVQLVTLLTLLLLQSLCRTNGIFTSGTLFLTWLTLVSCAVPVLVWCIMEFTSVSKWDVGIFGVHFISCTLCLFLHCFADLQAPSSNMMALEHQNTSAELRSSFLNQVTFWYFNMFAWRGYRKPLETDDLWSLNVPDQQRSLMRLWHKLWRPPVITSVEPTSTLDDMHQQLLSEQEIKTIAYSQVRDNGLPSSAYANGATPSRKRSSFKPFSANKSNEKTKRETKRNNTAVIWTVIRMHAWTIFGCALLRLVVIGLTFMGPKILGWLIALVQNPLAPRWHGYALAALLLVVNLLQSVITHTQQFKLQKIGMRASSVLTGAVFEKTLKLSNESRQERSVGQIVNLMSVDVMNFQPISWFMMLIWASPLQLIIGLYMIGTYLGLALLVGLVVIFVIIAPTYFAIRLVQRYEKEQMRLKDERMKLANEILNGIKVFKLYAWELSLAKMVEEIRDKEILVIRKMQYITVIGTAVIFSIPFFVASSSFAAFIFINGQQALTPDVAFVCLSLFNILRWPMIELPLMAAYAIQLIVSNRRLSEYLCSPEICAGNVEQRQWREGAPMVQLDGVKTAWSATDDSSVLSEMSLKVPRGQLIAVVGRVGAGKSTMLSTLLGETVLQAGRVGVCGSVAYVNQQPWIQVGVNDCCVLASQLNQKKNQTLKDNVLFGRVFDEQRYKQVIDACALTSDLQMLPNGDQTEIGERGINLSGGQKQRVSLARAVYANMDIYLLDDPLSAVDAHVGKHIFDQVIGPNGLLASKTRVLVTHQLVCLPSVDWIVVVKDGQVSQSGTYNALLTDEGEFARVLEEMKRFKNKDEEMDEENEGCDSQLDTDGDCEIVVPVAMSDTPERVIRQRTTSITSDCSSSLSASHNQTHTHGAAAPAGIRRRRSTLVGVNRRSVEKTATDAKPDDEADIGKLIDDEMAETGKVHWRVYLLYFKSLGSVISVLWMLFYIIAAAFEGLQNIWLAAWSNDNEYNSQNHTNHSDGGHQHLPFNPDDAVTPLAIYAAFGFGQTIWIGLATYTQVIGSLRASRSLHSNLIHALLRAPIQFFDVTPLGRILNRLGRDIYTIDFNLPNIMRTWWVMVISVFGTLGIILLSTPAFAIVVLPLGFVYFVVMVFYIATTRQLVRLQSVTKSPVYSHFQETIQGASTIRAFRDGDRFITESQKRVDLNNSCSYPNIIANQWLWVRLELIGNLVTVSAAVFALYYSTTGMISPGVLGLSITYAMGITGALGGTVQFSTMLEQNVVAVERVKDYTNTKPEAPWRRADKRSSSSDEHKDSLPVSWPSKGRIVIEQLSVRYRPELDCVLHDINLTIESGEKIGVAGRTGAGKSSLTLVLFRLIEPCNGRILIDDIDICTLGLHELRNKLTIIPQDPVLFCGTLRANLDPIRLYSDHEIWQALEHAHLESTVRAFPKQLEHEIVEGGENLSVGQRQLVCLARALLRRTQILVLDEATAACDVQTDGWIQSTIKTAFADCTVITIAHRLNTILDCDRIVVLDKGKIAEVDKPSVLLANEQSVFYSMAHAH